MNRIDETAHMTLTILAGSIPAVIAISLLALGGTVASEPADLLIINARIITMDERQPTAGAVAIRGDRIQWVGSSDEAKRSFVDAMASSPI